MPQNIDVHALNFGELETEVLRKLWINPQEDSNGFPAAVAFGKYSKYRIDKKLNKAYSDLVVLSKSFRSWFIITLKANYTQYPVPLNCFSIEKVYYFNTATTYHELKVWEETLIEEILLPGWMTTPSIPQYAYVADRNKMIVKLGVAPAPNTDGTAPTLGSVSNQSGPYGVIEGVSGSAAPGSSNLKFVDTSGQNFVSLGVIVGITVLNITDGSKGVISSITTTNTSYDTINVTSLTGGSVNVFTPEDEIRFLYGEYNNLITIGTEEAQYLLSSITGSLHVQGITMGAGNLLVRGYMRPILLKDNNQYPELDPTFHQAIALGAAAELGQEEPADSPEFAQAVTYRQSFNEAINALAIFSALQHKGTISLQSRR